MTLQETKDLIAFLFQNNVANFEGFGVKFEFKPNSSANPFSNPDPEERRKQVMAAFKEQVATDESDLYYSSMP